MRSETGRAAEAGAFASAVQSALAAWLAPSGCRRISRVPATPDGDWPRWSDEPAGWLFRDGRGGALLFGFDRADALTDVQVARLASCLAATSCLVETDEHVATEVLVSEAAAGRLVHDLRNRLNSLLMSASVLAGRLPAYDKSARFAAQLDRDGQACSDLLAQLTELMRPTNSRPMS